jgi:hypothetical protein
MVRYVIGAAALALAVVPVDPAGAQRVRAGVLTCDISAGLSFVIGSEKRSLATLRRSRPARRRSIAGRSASSGSMSAPPVAA